MAKRDPAEKDYVQLTYRKKPKKLNVVLQLERLSPIAENGVMWRSSDLWGGSQRQPEKRLHQRKSSI